MARQFAWVPAAILLAVGCGNGSSESAGAVSCSGSFDAGHLPPPVALAQDNRCLGNLDGTKGPGDACQANTDCAPSCCACTSGSNTALVAWCAGGVCASANATCCAFQQFEVGFCQQ